MDPEKDILDNALNNLNNYVTNNDYKKIKSVLSDLVEGFIEN